MKFKDYFQSLNEATIPDTEIDKNGFFIIDKNADKIAKYLKTNSKTYESLDRVFNAKWTDSDYKNRIAVINSYGTKNLAVVVDNEFKFVGIQNFINDLISRSNTSVIWHDTAVYNWDTLEIFSQLKASGNTKKMLEELEELYEMGVFASSISESEAIMEFEAEKGSKYKKSGYSYVPANSSSALEYIGFVENRGIVCIGIKGVRTDFYIRELPFNDFMKHVKKLVNFIDGLPSMTNTFSGPKEAAKKILELYKSKNFKV